MYDITYDCIIYFVSIIWCYLLFQHVIPLLILLYLCSAVLFYVILGIVFFLFCFVLYFVLCFILVCSSTSYYIILPHTSFSHVVLYYFIQYNTIFCVVILYHIILYYTILCYVFVLLHCTV